MTEERKKTIKGIRELAAYLQVSVVTAQRLKNDGKVPFYQIYSRVFFDAEQVDRAIGRIV